MSASAKQMGPIAATVLVAGMLMGSGVYLLPTTLAAFGSITIFSWGIAAAGALILAAVFGLLGVLRPQAEGAVAYAEEALHPALGHLGWFINWLSYWTAGPAVLVAAVGYLGVFFPILKVQTWSLAANLALIWLFVLANWVGPRLAARIGGATLVVGLAPVLLVIAVGLFAFDPHIFRASWNVSGKSDIAAVTLATAPVMWAFVGLECANMAARVIHNPQRNLPIAVVGGVAISVVVYVSLSVTIMGLLPAKTLAASSAPFADALRPLIGALAAGFIAVCACAKALGTFSNIVLVTAEMSRSAAASGFLPGVLSSGVAQPRPTRDLVFTGGLMTFVAVASSSPTLGGQFAVLINISVLYSMSFYALCSAALVVLAKDLSTPARRAGARAAGLAGAGFSAWVIASADPGMRAPVLATLAVGLCAYGVSRWARRGRQAT